MVKGEQRDVVIVLFHAHVDALQNIIKFFHKLGNIGMVSVASGGEFQDAYNKQAQRSRRKCDTKH